jgi:tetratricopeptide (TPR) repeat protein
MISKAYFEDGQSRKAEKHLRLALEMEPNFAEAHCNLAVTLHAQRRLSGARQHYEAALASDSTMVEAMAGLGTLLCGTNRPGLGIEYLERVLDLDPSRLKARYNLAVAYHQVDDFAKAIVHLLYLLSEQPGYPGGRHALAQAYFSRGLILLNAKKPQESLEFFENALKGGSDDDFFFATGIAYLKMGEMQQAERAFLAAIELNEEHVPALHNLATVLELTDRASKAWQYYDRVRALAPHIDSIEAARAATYDEAYLME